MQCGAPAAPSRRPEKIPGRNRIGLVALNGLVPGGVPPAPNPPHPIRPIGPGLPQKAGVSLFVAATARKLSSWPRAAGRKSELRSAERA
jgi:hypothetical protein